MEFRDVLVLSLLRSWDGFISTLLGSRKGANDLGQTQTSLQELFALIKDEYECQTGRLKRTRNGATGTNIGEQAFVAEPRGKQHQLDDKYNTCGGASHYARNCLSVGKLTCGNCHNVGHLQKDCFSPGGLKHDPKCWKGKKRKK